MSPRGREPHGFGLRDSDRLAGELQGCAAPVLLTHTAEPLTTVCYVHSEDPHFGQGGVMTTVEVDQKPEHWLIRTARYLRANPSTVTEVLTLLAGVVVLILDVAKVLDIDAMVSWTVVILTLLAISGLLERAARLERIDQGTQQVNRFLHDGGLASAIQAPLDHSFRLQTMCSEIGVAGAYSVLSDVPLVKAFQSAERDIRILQTWTGNLPNIKDELARAAGRGCSVRVLLLNPYSEIAKYRSRDLEYIDELGRDSILPELRMLAQAAAAPEAKGGLEVRVYDALPSISIYAYDHTRIVGVFWQKVFAMASPQVRIEADHGTLAPMIDAHFEAVWDHPRTKILTPSSVPGKEVSLADKIDPPGVVGDAPESAHTAGSSTVADDTPIEVQAP